MDKIEHQINEIKGALNVIREKREQLKERSQMGVIDRVLLRRLRMEDKIIDQVQRRGRLSIEVLKLMKAPETRKRIIALGLMDENTQNVVKELKKFAKQISKGALKI